MNNVGTCFEILEEGHRAPKNYKQVTSYLMFDEKFNLQEKLDRH